MLDSPDYLLIVACLVVALITTGFVFMTFEFRIAKMFVKIGLVKPHSVCKDILEVMDNPDIWKLWSYDWIHCEDPHIRIHVFFTPFGNDDCTFYTSTPEIAYRPSFWDSILMDGQAKWLYHQITEVRSNRDTETKMREALGK